MTQTARALLRRIEAAFEARRDPVRAAAMSAYMRDRFPFYGIPSPERTLIFRDAARKRPTLSHSDVEDLARACWRRDEREYQYAACWFLRRHAKILELSFVDVAEQLITTRSWWDTVDELAAHVVGVLVRRFPDLRATMDAWIDSENFWLARTAILHQTRYRADTDADVLFSYCLRRAPDTEFFTRKAIGWALREYAKVDAVAVRRFVRKNDDNLSGLSKREALKHLR